MASKISNSGDFQPFKKKLRKHVVFFCLFRLSLRWCWEVLNVYIHAFYISRTPKSINFWWVLQGLKTVQFWRLVELAHNCDTAILPTKWFLTSWKTDATTPGNFRTFDLSTLWYIVLKSTYLEQMHRPTPQKVQNGELKIWRCQNYSATNRGKEPKRAVTACGESKMVCFWAWDLQEPERFPQFFWRLPNISINIFRYI